MNSLANWTNTLTSFQSKQLAKQTNESGFHESNMWQLICLFRVFDQQKKQSNQIVSEPTN